MVVVAAGPCLRSRGDDAVVKDYDEVVIEVRPELHGSGKLGDHVLLVDS